MKYLLVVFGLLTGVGRARGQAWANPLPVDSATGYITYRGRIEAPGQTMPQALARASRYARTQLTDKPEILIDSSRAGQPVVSGAGQRGFAWRGGPAGTAGRVLHYELLLRPHAGYYEYELGTLTNETPAVQYSVAPGLATTTGPRRGAVEAVLRNPTSYDKKRRPTAALRSYCEAVNEAAQATLSDVRVY